MPRLAPRIRVRLASTRAALRHWLRSHGVFYFRRARVVCRSVPEVLERRPGAGTDIREASAADLRALAAAQAWDASEWLDRRARGDVCLVACSGPAYLGYVWISRTREVMAEVDHVLDVSRDPGGVYLFDGYVFPPHRRQGVLRALLATSMDWARVRGASRAYAGFVRENHASERALGQAGFVTVLGDVSLLRVLGREWKWIRVPSGRPWAVVLGAAVPSPPRPSPT